MAAEDCCWLDLLAGLVPMADEVSRIESRIEAAFRAILFRLSAEYWFGNVASNASARLGVSTRSCSEAPQDRRSRGPQERVAGPCHLQRELRQARRVHRVELAQKCENQGGFIERIQLTQGAERFLPCALSAFPRIFNVRIAE
jgi:hypothetical protein